MEDIKLYKTNKQVSDINEIVSTKKSYNNCREKHSIKTCALAIAAEKAIEKSYDIVGKSIAVSGLALPAPVAIPTVVSGIGISSMGEYAGKKAKDKILSTAAEYNSCRVKNSALTCAAAIAIDNVATAAPLVVSSALYPILGREICDKEKSRKIGNSVKNEFINVVDLAHLTLNTPKGIKVNSHELDEFDFLSEFFYDMDLNCFMNDETIIEVFPINMSYLKDILYLLDNDIEDFGMSFENYKHVNFKIECTNLFYPPIVGSLEIGRVMTEADKTLKNIISNSTYNLTMLNSQIVKQFPETQLNLSGFFKLSNCNIKLIGDNFIYEGNNIKFKAHDYSNNEIDENINNERINEILKFQDVLNNSFDKYKRIYGDSLNQLEELAKAVTIARLISDNNCEIIGDKNVEILETLHNTKISLNTKIRAGTISGGIIVSSSSNLFKKYKTDFGNLLRIIQTIDPDLYVENKNENILIDILSDNLEDSKFKKMINTNKIIIYELMNKIINENLFFDRYSGEFVEELSYSKRDVMEIVVNTQDVKTIFNNLPHNTLAERILDNIGLNSKTLIFFSDIVTGAQSTIKK